MKKCSRCGFKVQDNQQACPKCGGRTFVREQTRPQVQNTQNVGNTNAYSPDFGDPFASMAQTGGQSNNRPNFNNSTENVRFTEEPKKQAEDAGGWDIKKWVITMLIMALGPIAIWYGTKKMNDETIPLMVRNYFKVATTFSLISFIISVLVMCL